MKNLVAICVLFITLAVLSEAQLKIQSCPGTKRQAIVSKLEIDDCKSYPCSLKRGSNASIKFTLKPLNRINNVQIKIAGVLQGKAVPFTVNDPQHCKTAIQINGTCPLSKGKSYDYVFSMPVKQEYPTVSLYVKYELVDQTGKSVLCFQWPASIQ